MYCKGFSFTDVKRISKCVINVITHFCPILLDLDIFNLIVSCCAHFSLALRFQVIAEFANFNPSRPDDGRREKTVKFFFIFTILCGSSKGFTRAEWPSQNF